MYNFQGRGGNRGHLVNGNSLLGPEEPKMQWWGDGEGVRPTVFTRTSQNLGFIFECIYD